MWLVILITSLTFRIKYYTQVSRLLKAFTNNSSGNIKLSKTHLYEIGESGGFSGRFLGPILNIGLPLMKNVLKCT